MRPDVGLHTLPTRIAGLRSLTAPRTAPQPAAGGGDFADALDQQLGALGGATGTAAGAYAGAPAAGTGFVPALLGQGVRATATPGLIAPAHPGTSGVGSPAGYGGIATAPSLADALAAVQDGPPAELRAYGNGQIPPQALAQIGVGDHQMWAPAAQAFQALLAHARADGVTIGVNSSYRDLAGQQEMVDRYGLYSQGGRAAAPGSSDHGWGLSIDLQLDDRAQAWMRANAAAYGFAEDVPREPWHWTFGG